MPVSVHGACGTALPGKNLAPSEGRDRLVFSGDLWHTAKGSLGGPVRRGFPVKVLFMARDRNSRDVWEEQVDEKPRARWTGVFEKFKDNRWIRENPNLVKGIAAGALLVAMVLLFRWQMGWTGATEEKRRLSRRRLTRL